MKKLLLNASIQNKLLGVFAVVFVAGVLAIGWNIWTINDAKADVAESISDSKQEISETLANSRAKVEEVVTTGRGQVFAVFDQSDELLYLNRIVQEFYELEAIEKDYVLAADPADADGRVEMHDTLMGWISEDLALGIESATTESVSTTLTALQAALEDEAAFFEQVVETMQDDPTAAQQLSLERSVVRVDSIYNPLSQLLNDQWDATIEDTETTRTQMTDALTQTRSELQESLAQSEAEMQQAAEQADSQLEQTITVSYMTIVLFLLAGAIVAVGVYMISRQIVRPVLQMADVARAVEQEQYRDAGQLESIAQREDEIGQLARVFQHMANEVFTRIERLKQQVAELRIEIDERRVSQEVEDITSSDYFQNLQARASSLRQRQRRNLPGDVTPDADPAT